MFIASKRDSGHAKFDCFDMQFNHLNLHRKYSNAEMSLYGSDSYDERFA